jgi:hypothetical protein
MKRKPLSMLSLHKYVIDFLEERSTEHALENGGDIFPEQLEDEAELLKSFLGYIWKNPK